VLSGPTSQTRDIQAVGSHRSDGDGERCCRVPQVGHMICKPSGPTSQMEMEKGVVGSHKSDGEGSTSTSDTQAVRSHKLDGERPHRYR
jgi:hypothetical protein